MLLSDWMFVIIMLAISASILGYAYRDLYKDVKKEIEIEKERVITIDNEELVKRAEELNVEVKGSDEE